MEELDLLCNVMQWLLAGLLVPIEQLPAFVRDPVDGVGVRREIGHAVENAQQFIMSDRRLCRIITLYELVELVGINVAAQVRQVLRIELEVCRVHLYQLTECVQKQQEERLNLPCLQGKRADRLLVHRMGRTEQAAHGV